jgi:hypothetical protein
MPDFFFTHATSIIAFPSCSSQVQISNSRGKDNQRIIQTAVNSQGLQRGGCCNLRKIAQSGMFQKQGFQRVKEDGTNLKSATVQLQII